MYLKRLAPIQEQGYIVDEHLRLNNAREYHHTPESTEY